VKVHGSHKKVVGPNLNVRMGEHTACKDGENGEREGRVLYLEAIHTITYRMAPPPGQRGCTKTRLSVGFSHN